MKCVVKIRSRVRFGISPQNSSPAEEPSKEGFRKLRNLSKRSQPAGKQKVATILLDNKALYR